MVYSGEGQEAVLVCIVHGESQPEVSFSKQSSLRTYNCNLSFFISISFVLFVFVVCDGVCVCVQNEQKGN